MFKKLLGFAALPALAFIVGCTNTVAPEPTRVKAENDLTTLTVNIGGISTTLDEVDLYNLTIGDATFPYVAGGTTSSSRETSPGIADIYVDSAVGYVGGRGVYLFTNISASTTDLNAGVTNTVVFDQSSLLTGATVTVRETEVEVENDLTGLSVDVNGQITNVDEIDLFGITIGDVVFPYVQGGTTSAAVSTGSIGTVTITIDSAYVWTTVLGQLVSIPFTNIGAMTTDIVAGTVNTVVFDESTAGAILQALGKRKAK